jgi:hypothetical protein
MFGGKLQRGHSLVKICVVINDMSVISGYDLLEHDAESGIPSLSIYRHHLSGVADGEHFAMEPFVKQVTLAGFHQARKPHPAAVRLHVLH